MPRENRSSSSADTGPSAPTKTASGTSLQAAGSSQKTQIERRTSDGLSKSEKKEEKKRLGTMRSKSSLLKGFHSSKSKIKDDDEAGDVKISPPRQLSATFSSPMGDSGSWPEMQPETAGKVFGRDLTELSLATHGTKECQRLLEEYMKSERPVDFDPVTSLPIPRVITVCIAFLENHLDEEGLFRISGGSSEIGKVKKFFEGNISTVTVEQLEGLCRDELIGVAGVAAVLKQFFRLMPEPVLPSRFYTTVLKILENDATSQSEKVARVRTLVKGMPPLSRLALMHLCQFLRQVSKHEDKNKMGVENLAVVWGPNLIRQVEADESGGNRNSLGSSADLSSLFHLDKIKIATTVLIKHAQHLWVDSKNDLMRRQIKSELVDQFTQSSAKSSSSVDASIEAEFAAKLAAATAALGSTLKQSARALVPDVPGQICVRAFGWIALIQGMSAMQRFARLETFVGGGHLALFEKDAPDRTSAHVPTNVIPLCIAGTTTCKVLSGAECRIFGHQNLVKITQKFRDNEGQNNVIVFSCGSETDRDAWTRLLNECITPRIVASASAARTTRAVQTQDLVAMAHPEEWVVQSCERIAYCRVFHELLQDAMEIRSGKLSEILGLAAARLGVDAAPEVLAAIVSSVQLPQDTEGQGDDSEWIGESEFIAACFLLKRHANDIPLHVPTITWVSIHPNLFHASTPEEFSSQRRACVSEPSSSPDSTNKPSTGSGEKRKSSRSKRSEKVTNGTLEDA